MKISSVITAGMISFQGLVLLFLNSSFAQEPGCTNARDLYTCPEGEYCRYLKIDQLPQSGMISIRSYQVKLGKNSDSEKEIWIGRCQVNFKSPFAPSTHDALPQKLHFSSFIYRTKINGLEDANRVDLFEAQVDSDKVQSVTCKINRSMDYFRNSLRETVDVISEEFEYDAELYFKF